MSVSRLMALYPATWRQRYEDEFLVLLETRPPSLGDRIDIVRGALDAHLRGSRRTDLEPDSYWRAVVGGFACFLLALVIAASGSLQQDEFGVYREGTAALPFVALAMVILAVGLGRVVTALPRTAVAGRAGGWTAVVAGPVWTLMPWVALVGLVFLVGLVLLAVGARRSGIWPWWAEVTIVALVAPLAGLFAATLFLPWYAIRVSGLDLSLLIVVVGVQWPLLALLLRRGLPPVAEA